MVLICLSCAFGADSWFVFQPGRTVPIQGPAITMWNSDSRQISFSIELEGVLTGAGDTHGLTFATLDLPEAGVSTELGRPRLPVIRRFLEIPAGANYSISVQELDSQVFPLRALGIESEIFPVQLPVEKLPGAEAGKPFQKDASVYGRDAFYPELTADVTEPLSIRANQLILAEFTPIQYNPIRREIRVVTRARLDIDLAGGDPAASATDIAAKYSPSFERWFGANVLNHQAGATRGTSTDHYAEGILIIAGSAYAGNANLAAYIDSRRAEGYKVELVNVTAIGNSDTAIRTYVRAQYLAWANPALSYVVLVGDVADVATHDGSGGGGSQATDLYYSAIDPDSYTTDWSAPDVIVSRISVNSTAELDTYMLRALKYTTANFTDTAWMKKLSFPASCDNYSISEGTHNYVFNTYTVARGFTGTFPSNPNAGGDKIYCHTYSASEANELSAFNDGRSVINDSGHGAETYWADPMFDDMAGINNPTAMPFVISNACVTGTYDYSGGDCWGEMWLSHSPGGAILFWGASNNSYWNEDDILERKMWDGIFGGNITRLGDIVLNAKLQTLANYGPNSTMYYYFEMYNMLGDCTIDLYTDAYHTLAATYPTEILLGVNTIDFSIADGRAPTANALVCVRGSGVQQSGTTDASGNLTIVMDPAPGTVMTLEVTITAHNGQRHTGAINVIPATGPYLSHTGHELTTDGATPTTASPGRHIVMPVTLANVGSVPAQGIGAVLSTTSTYATVTVSSATFNDIPAGGSGRSLAHYEFTIHSDTPDNTSIPFVINWTTTSRTTGHTNFSVVVRKPVLSLTYIVDDSAAGCDMDGLADAGEPTVFSLTIRNQGSCDANNVTVTLAAPGCTVSAPAAIPVIPNGGQAIAAFTVTPGDALPCPDVDVPFTMTFTANELVVPAQLVFTEILNADYQTFDFQDNMEGGAGGWTHASAAGMPSPDDWQIVTSDYHSASHSWKASGANQKKDAWLISPNLTLGDTNTLTFWHRMDLDPGYEGGVLELSTNGGSTWQDLGAAMTTGGYAATISSDYWNPLHGRQAWSGAYDWQETVVDLSGYAPGTVSIRFRIGCDTRWATGAGWWIDDVHLVSQSALCQAQDCGPVCEYGDLDRSGLCDAADCGLLSAYLGGSIGGFTCATEYADLNGDLLVTAEDLTILLNHVAGNIPVVPVP